MRNQHVSLYVEWIHRKDIHDICAFLISNGVRDLYVDEDMDQQYIPGQSYSHDHIFLRDDQAQAVMVHRRKIEHAAPAAVRTLKCAVRHAITQKGDHGRTRKGIFLAFQKLLEFHRSMVTPNTFLA